MNANATTEKHMDKYIARDCHGSALQFTESGRSIQCDDRAADTFLNRDDAVEALKLAGESQGEVESVNE